MSDFLQGVEIGSGEVDRQFQTFREGKDRAQRWTQMLAEKSQEVAAQKEQMRYEREKDAPLSVDQLENAKKTGILEGPGVTKDKQIAFIGAQQKADQAALKGHTVLTQEVIDKNPIYKKAGLVPGTYPDTFINEQTKPKTGAAGLPPEKMSALVDKVGQGKSGLLPEDIFKGMGQAAARQQFMSELTEKYPNWNASAAQAKRRELLGEANTKGTKGYVVATAAKAVDANLRDLKPLIESAPTGGIEALSGALRRGEKQVQVGNAEENKKANKLLTLLMTTAYEEARVENGGNAPNDDSQKAMRAALADGLDKNGFEGVQEAFQQTNVNRILSYENPWETTGTTPPAAGADKHKALLDKYGAP